MKIDNGFMNNLENKIKEVLPKAFDMDEGLNRLDTLLNIYSSIVTIQMHEAQLRMTENTMKAMKDIDFSKLNVSEVLKSALKG